MTTWKGAKDLVCGVDYAEPEGLAAFDELGQNVAIEMSTHLIDHERYEMSGSWTVTGGTHIYPADPTFTYDDGEFSGTFRKITLITSAANEYELRELPKGMRGQARTEPHETKPLWWDWYQDQVYLYPRPLEDDVFAIEGVRRAETNADHTDDTVQIDIPSIYHPVLVKQMQGMWSARAEDWGVAANWFQLSGGEFDTLSDLEEQHKERHAGLIYTASRPPHVPREPLYIPPP